MAARRISRIAASLLLVLYGFVFVVVNAPDIVVKTLFLVIGLFYFVAGFGVMRNRLWGVYISGVASIPVVLIGILRTKEVLALSGSVDPGALYLFLLPSSIICASSIWATIRSRGPKSVHETVELSRARRRVLKYAAATAIAVAVALTLGLDYDFNRPRPTPSEIVSVANTSSRTSSENVTSTTTSTTTSVSSASSTTTTRPQEVDVGLLLVPVDFDGHVSPGEYDKDTIDYRYWGSPVPEGHLHVKNDGTWTFFGLQFLGDEETSTPYRRIFSMWFDTQNTGRQGFNIPGVYTFQIEFRDPRNPIEIDPGKAYPWMENTGTPFVSAFVRGKDYDWKYHFEGGTQLEIKIKTEILTRYFNEIGITSGFLGPNQNMISINGQTVDHPYEMWLPLKFKDAVLTDSRERR